MARQQAFTPATLDNLKSGKISDPSRPGLAIEATTKGKLWRYYRRIAGCGRPVKMTLGRFPVHSIAAARQWADDLNAKVEAGEDPRVEIVTEKASRAMTLAVAWDHYIADVSRPDLNKPLKARTIADKKAIFNRDIEKRLGSKPLASITANHLWELVEAKGETGATVRANRLAAELKVMFKWFATSRGAQKHGIILATDPAVTLNGKHFGENDEAGRMLTDEEIGWLFQALAHETGSAGSASYRRAFLLMLLTGCRIKEVVMAPATEISGATWTIPKTRTKNRKEHTVYLGSWGQALTKTNDEYLIPHPRRDGPIESEIWYGVRDRLLGRMTKIAKREVEHWRPHDLRVTLRSNTFDHGIPFEAAEAMLNHKKKGLEGRYDKNKMVVVVADGFAVWERHLISIASKVGVAEKLGVPNA